MKGVCEVAGCGKPRKGRRDMCGMHIERVRKHGSTDKQPRSERCVIPDCPAPLVSQYRCAQHRQEQIQANRRARFERDVIRKTGCWGWVGTVSTEGYARVGREYAHRLSYTWFVGPIPDGLQIDHLCRNRACVNPGHLEPVTPQVNTLRGNSPSAISVRTNRCYRGHEFTPENTYLHTNGRWRQCRTCIAMSAGAA